MEKTVSLIRLKRGISCQNNKGSSKDTQKRSTTVSPQLLHGSETFNAAEKYLAAK